MKKNWEGIFSTLGVFVRLLGEIVAPSYCIDAFSYDIVVPNYCIDAFSYCIVAPNYCIDAFSYGIVVPNYCIDAFSYGIVVPNYCIDAFSYDIVVLNIEVFIWYVNNLVMNDFRVGKVFPSIVFNRVLMVGDVEVWIRSTKRAVIFGIIALTLVT